jgi:ABC-2 type transport system permease protein
VTRFLLVFGMTLRQLVARRRSIVLVILALVPAGLGVIAREHAAPYPDTPFLDVVSNIFNGFLVQVLCLFYGASVIRDAIEDRSAVFTLTTPTSRPCYVLGAWAALVVNVLLILELAVVATFLVWGAGLPGPFPGGEPLGPECRSLMGSVAAGVLVYSALFMTIGMYTRHCAVIGVVFYMVFDVFLASVPGPARRLAISAHLDALLDERFRTRQLWSAEVFDELRPDRIPEGVAASILAIWLALVLVTLLARARRQDFMDLSEPGK